jgi:hypothetical protein
MHRLSLITLLLASTTSGASPNRLVVHEWGTFTSIAGDDGVAIDWRPLVGPPDLPSFVYGIDSPGAFRELGESSGSKGVQRGTVRMETPVLYFYADREMTVSARVEFPNGRITEWYPQAKSVEGGIDWGQFRILPDVDVTLPNDGEASHYYLARETDAAPVRLCGEKTESEKFLFYRGVGTFPLPLNVRLDGDYLNLRELDEAPIGKAIVFERHGRELGYRMVSVRPGDTRVERPSLTASMDSLASDLESSLVSDGLYSKEASAMVETWKKDWFEDGLRVFFVMPTRLTDRVLPLTVEPVPAERVRVLVGRVEVITPDTLEAVRATLGQLQALRGEPFLDRDTIVRQLQERYGRFAEPIFKRLLAQERDAAVRGEIASLVKAWEPQSSDPASRNPASVQ